MDLTPDDKVRLCNALAQSPEWAVICEYLEREIKFAESGIGHAIRSQDYNRASLLSGMRDMAEKIKTAPMRVRKENTGIIKRISDFVRTGQIQTNGG